MLWNQCLACGDVYSILNFMKWMWVQGSELFLIAVICNKFSEKISSSLVVFLASLHVDFNFKLVLQFYSFYSDASEIPLFLLKIWWRFLHHRNFGQVDRNYCCLSDIILSHSICHESDTLLFIWMPWIFECISYQSSALIKCFIAIYNNSQ